MYKNEYNVMTDRWVQWPISAQHYMVYVQVELRYFFGLRLHNRPKVNQIKVKHINGVVEWTMDCNKCFSFLPVNLIWWFEGEKII